MTNTLESFIDYVVVQSENPVGIKKDNIWLKGPLHFQIREENVSR